MPFDSEVICKDDMFKIVAAVCFIAAFDGQQLLGHNQRESKQSPLCAQHYLARNGSYKSLECDQVEAIMLISGVTWWPT